MAILKLNGSTHFIPVREIKVEKVSNGRWKVTYDGNRDFLVVGGRESGGARNEWFCYYPEFYGETWLPANSMIAAIKLGAQY